MAQSKYDGFWKKNLEKHGGVSDVLCAARKNDSVTLAVEGIQEIGTRNSWYGKSIFGKKGKTGGDIMAHVAALKNLLPPFIEDDEEFVCQMDSKGTTLKVTWVG